MLAFFEAITQRRDDDATEVSALDYFFIGKGDEDMSRIEDEIERLYFTYFVAKVVEIFGISWSKSICYML